MKRIVLILFVSLLTLTQVMAQDAANAERDAKKMERQQERITQRIDKEMTELKDAFQDNEAVALSDEQKTELETLITEKTTKLSALKQKYKDDREGYSTERKPLAKEYREKIKNVLTEEQATAFKEYKEKKRAERKAKEAEEGEN